MKIDKLFSGFETNKTNNSKVSDTSFDNFLKTKDNEKLESTQNNENEVLNEQREEKLNENKLKEKELESERLEKKLEDEKLEKKRSEEKIAMEQFIQDIKDKKVDMEKVREIIASLDKLTENLADKFNIPEEELVKNINQLLANQTDISMKDVINTVVETAGLDDASKLLEVEGMHEFLSDAKTEISALQQQMEAVSEKESKEILKALELKYEEITKNINENEFSDDIINVEVSNTGSIETESTVKQESNINNLKNIQGSDIKVDNADVENIEKNEVETAELDNTNSVDDLIDTEQQSALNNSNSGQGQNTGGQQSSGNLNNTASVAGLNINTNSNQNVTFEDVQIARAQAKVSDPYEVNRQIIDKIKTDVQVGTSEINIKLAPENLGNITMKLKMENGIITANFIAESEQVKEIIESNFSSLEDTLRQQGVEVGELRVDVQAGGESPQEAFERESGRGNLNSSTEDNINVENVEEDETINNIIIDQNGVTSSKHNYTV